jgi:hypothetical protein
MSAALAAPIIVTVASATTPAEIKRFISKTSVTLPTHQFIGAGNLFGNAFASSAWKSQSKTSCQLHRRITDNEMTRCCHDLSRRRLAVVKKYLAPFHSVEILPLSPQWNLHVECCAEDRKQKTRTIRSGFFAE